MIVFLNGSFMDESRARIDPADRGFTLGDGVFDTMLAMESKLIFADKHFRRLDDHAGVLKIPFPFKRQELENIALGLIEKNGLSGQRAAIRTTISRGPGERGLAPPPVQQPTLLMRINPAPVPDAPAPLHVVVAQTVRRNEFSPLSRIKSTNYGDNLLALLEAQEKGTQDAIMLNTEGRVSCATTSNVFALVDGQLLTPPLSDGVMPGITRGSLLFRAIEKSLTVDDLMKADSVWLTNSIAGIRAVDTLNGVKFRNAPALAA